MKKNKWFVCGIAALALTFTCCAIDVFGAYMNGNYKKAIKLSTNEINHYNYTYSEDGSINNASYNLTWQLFWRGRSYLALYELEKAQVDFEKIIEIGETVDKYFFMLSKEYILQTRVQITALKFFNSGVDKYIREKNNPALHDLNEAIKIAPDFMEAYFWRAKIYYYHMNSNNNAESDYLKTIRLYSDQIDDIIIENSILHESYAFLASLYKKTNDYGKALACYNLLLEQIPDASSAKDWSNEVTRLTALVQRPASPSQTTTRPAQTSPPGPAPSLADDLRAIAEGRANAQYWSGRAENGEARAQFYLGVHYANGTGGVRRDIARAVQLYTRSAESGYDLAQYNLGLCYLDGTGVTKNERRAFEWFLKAADQGHAKAQYNAGVAYYFGGGTTKNAVRAVYYFTKSAEQRDPDAQFNLAMLYYLGEGVTVDEAKAKFWFHQASKQGNENAREALSQIGGYTPPRNRERDLLSRGYTKAAEGVYQAVLYKPFDDLKAGIIYADDNCYFVSSVYVESNFREDSNTWLTVMDQRYGGNASGVISDEPGKQKFFTMIFNDRTFIPRVGDTVYIGWHIVDTEKVGTSNPIEQFENLALYTLAASNGFLGVLFDSVPMAVAAAHTESDVLDKLRTRVRR